MRNVLKTKGVMRHFRRSLIAICLLVFSFNTVWAVDTTEIDGEVMELVIVNAPERTWVYWFPSDPFGDLDLDILDGFIPRLPDWLNPGLGGSDPGDDNQIDTRCLQAMERLSIASAELSDAQEYIDILNNHYQHVVASNEDVINYIRLQFKTNNRINEANREIDAANKDIDLYCSPTF